jgi:hypothetical protein
MTALTDLYIVENGKILDAWKDLEKMQIISST